MCQCPNSPRNSPRSASFFEHVQNSTKKSCFNNAVHLLCRKKIHRSYIQSLCAQRDLSGTLLERPMTSRNPEGPDGSLSRESLANAFSTNSTGVLPARVLPKKCSCVKIYIFAYFYFWTYLLIYLHVFFACIFSARLLVMKNSSSHDDSLGFCDRFHCSSVLSSGLLANAGRETHFPVSCCPFKPNPASGSRRWVGWGQNCCRLWLPEA